MICLAEVVASESAFGTAVAGMPSPAVRFSAKDLLAFLDAEPKRFRNIIAHAFALRQGIQETVYDPVTSDGLKLVGRRLLRMMELEDTNTTIPLNILQFDFAVSLGVSVPTVQRAFRKFKKYGSIETSYGLVAVRYLGQLKDFVRSFIFGLIAFIRLITVSSFFGIARYC